MTAELVESDESWLSLTLKKGKGFEDAHLKLSERSVPAMKRLIIETFGWDSSREADKLVVLAFDAQQEFLALKAVGQAFPEAQSIPADVPFEMSQEDIDANLIRQIEEHTDANALKRWRQANKDISPKVLEAWSAKGKALQAEATKAKKK